jgi:nicotinamidase-related amidase
MMAWARSNNIPIISTCYLNGNGNGNGNGYHMPKLNNGQRKVSYTLTDNYISFMADNNTDFPRDILRRYQQVIFHKRCVDPFDEPRIDRLLSEIRAGEFILIGTSTEGAVQATALGLLQRHKPVTVIVDAVGSRDSHEAKMALRKMEAKGAHLIETKRLAGTSHLRQVRACQCPSCLRITAKSPTPSPVAKMSADFHEHDE